MPPKKAASADSAASAAKGKAKAKATTTAPKSRTSKSKKTPANLPQLPSNVWAIVLQHVTRQFGLGQLFTCATVCKAWHAVIYSNPSPLDHALLPLCATYHAKPPAARTKSKSIASVLLAQYPKFCEVCHEKAPPNHPAGYMKRWPATNQMMCLACRVKKLSAARHKGTPIKHSHADMPRSEVVALGIPKKYAETKMKFKRKANTSWIHRGPMYLYKISDVSRVLYALTGKTETVYTHGGAMSTEE
ncbi:hypothetical protein BCR44DRAFT_1494921 [Catenaria anguillulae PL171]|uniref:F-box domain-containing protein n=1 Tax=Catenaria anguillulae PL171 TaxID=765915 RepID=A0A1Y2I5R3_9FUNG|nr:hypothetical protein BCR44DRAFT_1494921 [Catenaria anguillulae PL171]